MCVESYMVLKMKRKLFPPRKVEAASDRMVAQTTQQCICQLGVVVEDQTMTKLPNWHFQLCASLRNSEELFPLLCIWVVKGLDFWQHGHSAYSASLLCQTTRMLHQVSVMCMVSLAIYKATLSFCLFLPPPQHWTCRMFWIGCIRAGCTFWSFAVHSSNWGPKAIINRSAIQ